MKEAVKLYMSKIAEKINQSKKLANENKNDF